MNRADRLLVAFMRKMATDRIIMVFVCLVFLALIGAPQRRSHSTNSAAATDGAPHGNNFTLCTSPCVRTPTMSICPCNTAVTL